MRDYQLVGGPQDGEFYRTGGVPTIQFPMPLETPVPSLYAKPKPEDIGKQPSFEIHTYRLVVLTYQHRSGPRNLSRRRCPVYVSQDLTDEEAIEALGL